MNNFVDMFHSHDVMRQLPWLVLGKGPSFSQYRNFDLTGYKTLSLNHVVREIAVDVAHIIDIEVVADLGSVLEENARYVVMPWFPHEHFKASAKQLEQYTRDFKVLETLANKERLLWYDLDTGSSRNGDFDSVVVSNFSSEAAIGLLARAGARKIFTLGIDGGTAYDMAFADIQARTKFANGQLSFDSQFSHIAQIIRRYQIELAPLGEECPLAIFIGASQREWLPAKVLQYSIEKHSSITTQCYFLYQSDITIPTPQRADCQSKTSFSFQRFLIPELKNFSGKAIYLDSDMLVTDDISYLWQLDSHLDFHQVDLLCAQAATEYQRQSQFAVMLLNCDRLKWHIADLIKLLDDGTYNYSDLMHKMQAAPDWRAVIPPQWNSLDLYEPGITSLIHFTDMTQQPWLSNYSPEEEIWLSYLKEAVCEDFISIEEIQEQISKGNVRPSLLKQLLSGLADCPLSMSERLALDLDFSPPHRLMASSKNSFAKMANKLLRLFKKD